MPFTWSLAEALGASDLVGDCVSSGGARPAYYGIVGDDRAPLLWPLRKAPAYEAVRSGASTSRSLAELLDHPRGRGNRQTNKGTNVQRYTGDRRTSGAQFRTLLDGTKRPRLKKPVVARRLSEFLPVLPDSENRFDVAPGTSQKTRTVASRENRPALRTALALGTELGGLAKKSSTAPSVKDVETS